METQAEKPSVWASPAGEIIAKLALSYVGQLEIPQNQGFKDAKFEQRMRGVGWDKGQSWCAYFVKLCWKWYYFPKDQAVWAELDKYLNASAVQTLKNFDVLPRRCGVVAGCPAAPGCIVVWQQVGSWQGHAGIVLHVHPDGSFCSIEGNTSADGSRNGDRVAQHRHCMDEMNRKSGLRLLGFLHPPGTYPVSDV